MKQPQNNHQKGTKNAPVDAAAAVDATAVVIDVAVVVDYTRRHRPPATAS